MIFDELELDEMVFLIEMVNVFVRIVVGFFWEKWKGV